MKTIVSILAPCLVLAISLPLAAQAPDSHPLRLPILIFAGAAAADWATTYGVLATNRTTEGNPLLAMTASRPVPTVVVGAAMDVAGVWTWHHVVGRKHPKLAAVGLYVAASFRVYLAVRSRRMLQGINAGRYPWVVAGPSGSQH
jgi:hypothetical protein